MTQPHKPELVRRADATTATMNKYRNKPFNWKAGTTCIHLLRFHLRQLGYKPEPLPRIRSAIGARRALDKRGWRHVGDMLDTLLPRVPGHASMALGDIAMLRSGDGFGAITICAGPLKLMGWHDDVAGMAVMEPHDIEGVWRV
jgi:hypothetical protein